MGQGLGKYQPIPKRVVGIKKAIKVACGDYHTMVLTSYYMPALPHPEIDISEDAEEELSDCPEDSNRNADSDENDFESDNVVLNSTGVVVRDAPTLKQLAERSLASFVDCRSVFPLMDAAEALNAPHLASYCSSFLLWFVMSSFLRSVRVFTLRILVI